MSFLSELKRRNVIRMAGLYLVGAWLLTQVVGTVLPIFGAPDWMARSILILLAIGFIPAMMFAWIFELTPDGLKRDAEVTPNESIAPQTARRMERLIIALFALALIFFGFDKFVLAPKREATLVTEAVQASKSVKAPVSSNSIAVMPFVNMSSDKEQEYFSDGMTEEILNALANVPNLAVTARTSVFSLKGQNKDIREIGKLLGVSYVLEGSVRKAGDQVRITAQLIRADNGFHLWSETYDRKLENVFDMQAEIAGAIAKALELPLGIGGDAALVSERSADQQAYAMYLQARAAYRARGDGVKKSIALYREAIKRDPKFAPAWAGLASSLVVLPWYVPEAEKAAAAAAIPEAEQAGKQALALSPNLPQAHNALAMVYSFQWQWALAEQHFKQALALAPTDPDVHFQYADWLGAVGRSDEALASASKAVELDPLVPIFLNGKGNALLRQGRVSEAIEIRQVAYALAPDLQMTTNNLFLTYMQAKRYDEAEKLLDEIRASELARAAQDPASDPKKDVQRIRRASIRLLRDPTQAQAIRNELDDEDYTRLKDRMSNDIDTQFKNIETAFEKHVNGVDPVSQLRSYRFADYRKDPRYIHLLNKAGFDDEGNIR
jgi:TolB-like protein/Flp pilus assembly protein TadD